jgi:putative spermidine/putrescine transport system substrate-binding protein
MRFTSKVLSAAIATGVLILAGAAGAQQKMQFEGITLNINGYGGAYDDILKETVAKPLKDKYGLEVIYQPGGSGAATARLLASKDDPPFDLIMVDSPAMPQLIDAGVIEEIDEKEVPNAKNVYPKLREFGKYGLPFSIASVVLTANTKLVKDLPRSFKDLGKPDFKGHVGLITLESTGGVLTLLALAESNGGGVNNIEPGFAALRAIKPNVVAGFGATVPQLQAFQQEEILTGPFWNGRVYELQQKGASMALIAPSEGVYSLQSYVNAVKKSKNREAVLAYLDQAMTDAAIAALAIKFTYGPTTPVKLPDDIAPKVIAYGPEGLSKIKTVDWVAVAKNRPDWTTQWNKEMQ